MKAVNVVTLIFILLICAAAPEPKTTETVVINMTLTVYEGLKWNDTLGDISSTMYENRSSEIESVIEEIFYQKFDDSVEEFTSFKFVSLIGSTTASSKKSSNSSEPDVQVKTEFIVETQDPTNFTEKMNILNNTRLSFDGYSLLITNIYMEIPKTTSKAAKTSSTAETTAEITTTASTAVTTAEATTTSSTAETSTEATTTASPAETTAEPATTACPGETTAEATITASTAETTAETTTTANTAETTAEATTTASTAETTAEATTTASTAETTAEAPTTARTAETTAEATTTSSTVNNASTASSTENSNGTATINASVTVNATSTVTAATPEPKTTETVVINMTLTVYEGLKWNDTLEDTSSTMYENRSSEIKSGINETFYQKINVSVEKFTSFTFVSLIGSTTAATTQKATASSTKSSNSPKVRSKRDAPTTKPEVKVDTVFTVITDNSSKFIEECMRLNSTNLKFDKYTIHVESVYAKLLSKMPSDKTSKPKPEKKGFPGWAIALIILGSVVAVSVVIYVALKKKRKTSEGMTLEHNSRLELRPSSLPINDY